MFKSLLAAIGFGGPEYDGKMLAKDARNIVDMVHGLHTSERIAKIVQLIITQIDEVHERGLNDPQYYDRGIIHLTELNRAARQRRDDLSWSALTLAIIYIKAEILGEHGMPARNTIDGFIEKWRHTLDTPPTGDDVD